MKNYIIKSYCKINLSLNVLKKLKSGYHRITSLITFCNLHDIISISKIESIKDDIIFTGRFNKGIKKNSNTIVKVLKILREQKLLNNHKFKINVKKNIPHGSGLGGGSSNAASLLNYFNSKMKLQLNNKEIKKMAKNIGFDVPVNLDKKNTILTGKNDKLIRIKQKLNLNILIVYPNVICSTKKIYRKNKKKSYFKKRSLFIPKNKYKLIQFLKRENNDLEKTVIKTYPIVGELIDTIKSTKGCYFSRITGSGSACIGIFSNMKNANYARRIIKLKYPKYWCLVSKTI